MPTPGRNTRNTYDCGASPAAMQGLPTFLHVKNLFRRASKGGDHRPIALLEITAPESPQHSSASWHSSCAVVHCAARLATANSGLEKDGGGIRDWWLRGRALADSCPDTPLPPGSNRRTMTWWWLAKEAARKSCCKKTNLVCHGK